MKKLYSVKAKKYIPLLKNVIKNSIFIYNNKIEHEKLRGLQKIEELINKRKHVKIEIKN